jgi:hypothetical protein
MSRFLADVGNHAHHGHVVAFTALVTPVVAVIAPLGLALTLGVLAVVLIGLRRARTGI